MAASAFLSSEERRALEAELAQQFARANTDLMREGDVADRLYIVAEGWACRYKITRHGLRQIVALLTPGDMANLDSLVFESPGYGVRALTNATMLAIPRKQALALATHHAGIARTFTSLALMENAILSQWTVRLGRFSAKKRLAHLLCELSARLDAGNENEGSFELPLTQEQLGDALGLTAVHVNRTMQQLRVDGLIATANRSVTILDRDRLRYAGEFNPAYLHIQTVNTGEAR